MHRSPEPQSERAGRRKKRGCPFDTSPGGLGLLVTYAIGGGGGCCQPVRLLRCLAVSHYACRVDGSPVCHNSIVWKVLNVGIPRPIGRDAIAIKPPTSQDIKHTAQFSSSLSSPRPAPLSAQTATLCVSRSACGADG
jgi:hypothetical protein